MGLTAAEYINLLEFVYENHGWAKAMCKEGSKHIKYVDSNFDTRTGRFWRIRFIFCGTDKTFRTEEGYNLKDEIYKWLNEDQCD